jgi:choline-glycine betaine transporter
LSIVFVRFLQKAASITLLLHCLCFLKIILSHFTLTLSYNFVRIFITSDSGSLVVDNLTSGGKIDAPVQRIFWALAEGGAAVLLLIGGGLQALQSNHSYRIAICRDFNSHVFSLYKGLSEDLKKLQNENRKKDLEITRK